MQEIPITTAEPYSALFYHDGTPRSPETLDAVDVILVNIHPFHERVHVDNAPATLAAIYQQAVHGANGKQVIIAETGWPSAGETNGQAVPSLENAARFLSEAVAWAGANDVPMFCFEAFDEAWKGPPIFEQHWGAWYANGDLKIPEPASLWILGAAAAVLLRRRRRRRASFPASIGAGPTS